jgi:hypothetical protein
VHERDLGVGADIHDDGRTGAPRALGSEERRDVIAPDEAADVRQDVHVGAGRGGNPQIARFGVECSSECGHERHASELRDGQAKEQMVHGRVAAHGNIDDFPGMDGDRRAEIVREGADGSARRPLELACAVRGPYGVIHAAHRSAP